MTYATIPVFGGQFMHLYRETRLAFMVSDLHNLNNHHVYIVDQELGNCILSIDDDINLGIDENCTEEKTEKEKIKKNVYSTGVWKMFFEDASLYFGARARALLMALDNKFLIPFSYRLQWNVDHTNNICEYEALVLGLEASRRMKIKNLEIFSDAELIVK
jgi:hypothetical protein